MAATEYNNDDPTCSKHNFKASVLNVQGLTITVDDTKSYQYKMPYAIQIKPPGCCMQIAWILCPCICAKTGPADSMDFVDQVTGDQLRFHRMGRILYAFQNGQLFGTVAQSWRFCNSCRTCVGDWRKKYQPQLTFFDNNFPLANTLTRVVRPGKGACCKCYPRCPKRQINGFVGGVPISMLAICTCTIEAWPSEPTCGNGCKSYGCPHGCIFCDPVCCDCCPKGPVKKCGCTDCPCIMCCNPCGFCQCECPMCAQDTEELPITSTFKYEAVDMKSKDNTTRVGGIQMQYRGNVPFTSGYQHSPDNPFLSAMEHHDGGIAGLLSTATCVARSYFLGLETPMLSQVQFKIKSPDYDGRVLCQNELEMNELFEALDINNRVTKRIFLGPAGVCVQGYTLIGLGWDNSWVKCGQKVLAGGKSSPIISCTQKKKAEELFNNAKEGGLNPLFELEFYMEDPEIPILSRDNVKEVAKRNKNVSATDHKFSMHYWDFYYTGGREKVMCELQCVRVWKCPCNFNKERKKVLSCVYKERPRQTTATEADLAGKPPNQIIMCIGKRTIES